MWQFADRRDPTSTPPGVARTATIGLCASAGIVGARSAAGNPAATRSAIRTNDVAGDSVARCGGCRVVDRMHRMAAAVSPSKRHGGDAMDCHDRYPDTSDGHHDVPGTGSRGDCRRPH